MTLDDLAIQHGTDKSSLVHDYARTYARYLDVRRDDALRVLELGVFEGASLRMWRDYFPNGVVFGVDNNPAVMLLDAALGPRVSIIMGDVRDEGVLAYVRNFGPWDLIVDDAAHYTIAQVHAARALIPSLAPGGLYVIEDTCCAYWAEYQRIPDMEGACAPEMREFVALMFDKLHKNGAREHGLARRHGAFVDYVMDEFEELLDGMHVHNSLVIFERTID